jgi:hypothetical protein
MSLKINVFVGADSQAPGVFIISIKGSVAEVEEKIPEINQALNGSGFCLVLTIFFRSRLCFRFFS